MSPLTIYGSAFANEGVGDLARSQANWGRDIQDKLSEFHDAEDVSPEALFEM